MQLLYKVAVIARFLNLTDRRVQQLARDGIIPKPEKGKYDLVGCVQGYVRYLQERAFGRDCLPRDTHIERARLIRAQADKTELEVEALRGNLITIEAVEMDWLTMVMNCRAKLLSIPTKTAFQIQNLKQTHEIEKFLKRTIYEALTELAIKDDESLISDDKAESEDGMDATARDDSEPVGGHKPQTKSRSKRRTRKVDN
jgi:phage terminase Nu1 subunit (DNA packaging protein)